MAGSLKEIAVKYKVSVATLSKVINDQAGVIPETKKRILEILQKEKRLPGRAGPPAERHS